MRLATPLLFLLLSLSLAGCRRTSGEAKIAIILGPDYIPGAELAAAEINSRGGVQGRRLVLESDRSGASNDPTLALTSALRFARSPEVLAVVGHGTSSASLAAAQVYNEAGLVQVAPMATSPLLSTAGPWTFRLCINDTQQGESLADYAFDALQKRRAFIFQISDDYGKGLSSYFRRRFIARGGQVLYQVAYTERPTDFKPHLDFRPYLELMPRYSPDLIFFAGRVEGALQLRQEMEALGLRVPVVGGDALYIASRIREEKKASEGLMLTLFFHPALAGNAATFVEHFRRQFGSLPDARAALTYDAVHLLSAAIAAGGASREAIRQSLMRVASPARPFAGVTGPIVFDEHGDAHKPFQVGRVQDGEVLLSKN